MTDRLFRLMERHQRLDDVLRWAQARRIPDPIEIARLRQLKRTIKGRLDRLVRPPSMAF